MKRWSTLAAGILIVGLVVWRLGGQGATVRFDTVTVRDLEQRLATGGPEAFREAFAELRPELADPVADYLDSVLALAEGRPEEAVMAARRAHDAAPAAWRPVSYLYAALAALARWEEAGQLVRSAREQAPDDERVLALSAHHLLRSPERDAEHAHALLDRLEALPDRVAADDDPSAVRPEQLLSLRVDAAALTGRRSAAVRYARDLATNWPTPEHEVSFGEAARLAGDNETAVRAYARAVTQQPARREWRLNHAQLLLQIPAGLGDLLATTEEMLGRWPGDRSIRVLRARALVRARDVVPDGLDAAEVIYRQLLAEDPDDLEVLRNRAALLYDWKQGGLEGDFLDESHRLLRRYVRLGGVPDGPLADIWTRLQERAARAPDDPGIVAARAAFEAEPGSPETLAAYVERLRASARDKEVGTAVRAALTAAPENPAIAALAAHHFMGPGADHDAGESLQRLAVVETAFGEDGLPEALRWLRCRALAETLQFEESRDDARALLTARPGTGHYLHALGRALDGLREPRAAEGAYRAAAATDPENDVWWKALADVLLRIPGGAAAAQREIEQRFSQAPRPRDVAILHGRALAGVETTRDAGLAALRDLVTRDPSDPAGHAGLGLALEVAGREDDARDALERWTRLVGMPHGPVRDAWERLTTPPR